MDFEFFEQLDAIDAQGFLVSYLEEGRARLGDLEGLVLRHGGGPLDFSVRSLEPTFQAAACEVAFVPCGGDVHQPAWPDRDRGRGPVLYEMTPAARVVGLRLGYYLGETFVQSGAGRLRWSLGDDDTAVQRQPVVDGFRGGVQMSPLLVTENLLRRLVEQPLSLIHI